jgi:hypothetical protein
MSNPISCVPNCCAEPTNVNVPGPEGADGTAGTNGSNGQNAYTLTTAGFTVPAKGSPTTDPVEFASTLWMVVGQPVFVEGAGIFTVSSIPDSTHAVLTYLDYSTNTNAGASIPLGSGVSPAGTQAPAPVTNTTTPLEIHGVGTGTDIGTTAGGQALGFSTTAPIITITTAGTWMLFARVRIDFIGKTYTTNETVTLHLRKNNTTDLANSTVEFIMPKVTPTVSYTAFAISLPPVLFVTGITTEFITIFAEVSGVAGAGSIQPVEASIVAVRLF